MALFNIRTPKLETEGEYLLFFSISICSLNYVNLCKVFSRVVCLQVIYINIQTYTLQYKYKYKKTMKINNNQQKQQQQ